MVTTKARKEFYATGRRKTSIARVRLLPGEGSIQVNGLPYDKYFGRESLQLVVAQAFETTGTRGKFDIAATLTGGGIASQAGALRHGISRALLSMNIDLRKPLKLAGFLTRDSREKERRKVGHRKARRSPQYSKR